MAKDLLEKVLQQAQTPVWLAGKKDGFILPVVVNEIQSPLTLFDSIDTSERVPIIELKSNYGLSNLRDIVTLAGNGAVTNDGVEYKLETTVTSGSAATLDSAERGRYIPGGQAQIGLGIRVPSTFTNDTDAKWGYFDDNNGFGFGVDATGIYIFTRRAGTDIKVYQSNWNGDKLDGTGASGLTLSLAEGNIFQIDFSWYGYGSVEFKVLLADGNNVQSVYTVHRFSPSQQTSVRDPNLPIRATVINGTSSTNQQVFVGGRQFSVYNTYNPNRRVNSQYRLALGSVGTTFLPTITFRRKSAFISVSVKVEGFDLITDANLIYQLRVNGSLTGANYTTPSNTTASETACEVDVSATAITGGELIYEGLISTSGSGAFQSGSTSRDGLLFDIPALQPITLCVRAISGTGTVSGVLRVREEW